MMKEKNLSNETVRKESIPADGGSSEIIKQRGKKILSPDYVKNWRDKVRLTTRWWRANRGIHQRRYSHYTCWIGIFRFINKYKLASFHPCFGALFISKDFPSVEISHFSPRCLLNANELGRRCLATALTAQQWKGRRGWRSFVVRTPHMPTRRHRWGILSPLPTAPWVPAPHPFPQSFIHLLTSCPKTKCSGSDSGCSISLMPPAAMRCRKDVLLHGVLCSS